LPHAASRAATIAARSSHERAALVAGHFEQGGD
jgi:hypothetical protein